jgi:hypothetical protein
LAGLDAQSLYLWRGFDSIPGGADSLLDFLFSRGQRIVRDMQRALLYSGFDHAV